MPRRELKNGKQVADWLDELGTGLKSEGTLTLIGSAALLWHAHLRGVTSELPEASMDVDPVTDSDEIALRCYEALIGSEFERPRLARQPNAGIGFAGIARRLAATRHASADK